MSSVFHVNGHAVSIQDYEKMSDPELYRLLKKNLPAVAETMGAVNGANRETVVAFLKFLAKEAR